MIALTIAGGLGNQMFMYATARALALRNNTDVLLNLNYGFKSDWEFKRTFELDYFNVKYKTNKRLTFDYAGGKWVRSFSRRLGFNLFAPSYKYKNDATSNHDVDKELLIKQNKNLYIEGYWQAGEYFEEYACEIRNDFTIKCPISKETRLEEETIFKESETPICVGVRLYEECIQEHGLEIIQEEFYLNAMRMIRDKVKNPVFYIFTQSPQWVKEKLMCHDEFDIRFICDKTENATIEDLYLMTKFKYHIISNSSFYWWGAWLANSNMVISTKNFYNSKSNCKGWIIL